MGLQSVDNPRPRTLIYIHATKNSEDLAAQTLTAHLRMQLESTVKDKGRVLSNT